jgi:hypothetical protein
VHVGQDHSSPDFEARVGATVEDLAATGTTGRAGAIVGRGTGDRRFWIPVGFAAAGTCTLLGPATGGVSRRMILGDESRSNSLSRSIALSSTLFWAAFAASF